MAPRLPKNWSKLPPQVGRALGRRRFLLLGAGVAISACAPSSQTFPSDPTTTKLIQHAHGETQVPINPTRIAVLGFSILEAVMALGVEPIAAPGMMFNNFQHLPATASEMADIGNPREPSLEQIATLQPDLILSSKIFTTPDTYSLLSQVAPTVVFDFENGIDWQNLNRLCGEALGKEAEVKQLEADYAAKLESLKAQLPESASQIQVSVASFYRDNSIYSLGKDTFTGTVLADAGFARPPQQSKGEGTQLSIESLGDIDGDVLFVINLQSQTQEGNDMQAALDKMKNHPLWEKLKVVRSQRVYEVGAHWFGAGYIAANLMLDDLLTHMGSST